MYMEPRHAPMLSNPMTYIGTQSDSVGQTETPFGFFSAQPIMSPT